MIKGRTVFLLFLLAAGILYVIDVEYLGKNRQAKKDIEERSIFSIEPGRVERFSLTFEGKKVEIGKELGQWVITSPVKAPANSELVEELIKVLSEQLIDEIVFPYAEDKQASFKEYGLEPAFAEISFYTDGAHDPQVASVGNLTEVNGNVYGKSTKIKGVFVTGEVFRKLLSFKLFDLREKRLLGVAGRELSKEENKSGDAVEWFEIRTATTLIKIEKQSDGGWNIVSPVTAKADKAITDKFVYEMLNLEAIWFMDELADEQTAMLSPAKTRISFYGKGGKKKLSLFIGIKDLKLGAVYARGSETKPVVLLPPGFYDDFPKNAGYFKSDEAIKADVESRLFSISMADVATLSIIKDGKLYSIRQNDAGWEMLEPKKTALDKSKAGAVVSSLLNSQVGPPFSGAVPVGKPPVSILIVGKDGREYNAGLFEMDESKSGIVTRVSGSAIEDGYYLLPKEFMIKISGERLEDLAK